MGSITKTQMNFNATDLYFFTIIKSIYFVSSCSVESLHQIIINLSLKNKSKIKIISSHANESKENTKLN
jgi:hypothetical protein